MSAIVIEFERLKKDNQELNKALELMSIDIAGSINNYNCGEEDITSVQLCGKYLQKAKEKLAKEELASVDET